MAKDQQLPLASVVNIRPPRIGERVDRVSVHRGLVGWIIGIVTEEGKYLRHEVLDLLGSGFIVGLDAEHRQPRRALGRFAAQVHGEGGSLDLAEQVFAELDAEAFLRLGDLLAGPQLFGRAPGL